MKGRFTFPESNRSITITPLLFSSQKTSLSPCLTTPLSPHPITVHTLLWRFPISDTNFQPNFNIVPALQVLPHEKEALQSYKDIAFVAQCATWKCEKATASILQEKFIAHSVNHILRNNAFTRTAVHPRSYKEVM